jgi:Ca2+-binding RTX toxin-like protein
VRLGHFLGQVLGTALGNLVGDDSEPTAWARMDYDEGEKEYTLSTNWGNDGGNEDVALGMANQIMAGVNNILGLTHGVLRSTSSAADIQIGYKGSQYIVSFAGGDEQSFGTPVDAINYAAFQLLKNFDLVGGHAVLMRAWHNSDATNIYELQEDLQIAEAFQAYLANPAGVLALMMNDPDSDTAKSWAIILQRAAELELHLPHEKDIDGGWSEILRAQGVDGEWIPNISGDSIVLTDPVTGEQTTVQHAIGPGYEIVRIVGTDGNDVIHVNIDGPSITHVDAGAGDDTIEGSEASDILVGGAGDDTINGHEGNDWLHGGSGEDTIDGGDGADYIVGSDDNDYLVGSAGDDTIAGNAGNDELYATGGGSDILDGGKGNDYLVGNTGADTRLYGQDGDDVLVGIESNTLDGGAGNDTFEVTGTGAGNVILIARGQGHDTIVGSDQQQNILRFDDTISVNELYFKRNSNDLKILVLGEDQSVTVKDYYLTSHEAWVVIQANQGKLTSTRGGILQAVANDLTLTAPTGQYNLISDSVIAAATNDFESGSVWTYYSSVAQFGSDSGTTINSDGVWGKYGRSRKRHPAI